MTIWKPLTCEGIVQYDENIQWVKTYKICKLHEKFSGQKLLEEIEKHNGEISKIRNKGKPKGFIAFSKTQRLRGSKDDERSPFQIL